MISRLLRKWAANQIHGQEKPAKGKATETLATASSCFLRILVPLSSRRMCAEDLLMTETGRTHLRQASGCFHGHDRELSMAPRDILGSFPADRWLDASMGFWAL